MPAMAASVTADADGFPPHIALPDAPPSLVEIWEPEKPDERKPLRLAQADVRVVITAGIAETTMTLRFANDTPRLLEGELVFPLPENATVSGFGYNVTALTSAAIPFISVAHSIGPWLAFIASRSCQQLVPAELQ